MDASISVFSIVVPAAVALGVVVLSHAFTIHRDRENKRREQRIGYLIGAFRSLAKANNHPRLYEVAADVEQAIGDIQLFGTPEQVALAVKFARDLGIRKFAEMDDLLISLRDSLRHELGERPVKGRFQWLRITRCENTTSAARSDLQEAEAERTSRFSE